MSKTGFLLSQRQKQVKAEVTAMFAEAKYFDITKVSEAVKVITGNDLSIFYPEEYRALTAWHCIDFDKMPKGVKNTLVEVYEEVNETLPASSK